MKELYPGYYRLTEEELKLIWENCYFAVDANILLRMYRYTEGKNTLIKVFEAVKDRLFIPHQVSMEYHERLKEKIYDQKFEYELVATQLSKPFDELKKVFSTKRLNLNLDAFNSELDDFMKRTFDHIEENKKSHPDLEKFSVEIASLFEGKVGTPYTQSELDEIYKEGEKRYKEGVPPGYGDIKEKQNRPKRTVDGLTYDDVYGDLVLWKQLIFKAQSEGKPIVFITEDLTKGDWVELYKQTKKMMDVHPSLRQEFLRETKQHFTIYSIQNFLQTADTYLNVENVDTTDVRKAIENVKAVDQIMDSSLTFIRGKNGLRPYYRTKAGILPNYDDLRKSYVSKLDELDGIHRPYFAFKSREIDGSSDLSKSEKYISLLKLYNELINTIQNTDEEQN